MMHITPQDLSLQLKAENMFLLDVRENWEREVYHIGGTHIPLANIVHQANQIPHNQPVVVYCRKGIRSQLAIQKLEEKFGYTNLINLKGGMEAWKRQFEVNGTDFDYSGQ